MSDLSVSMILKLVDQLTGPMRGATEAVQSFEKVAKAAGTTQGKIPAHIWVEQQNALKKAREEAEAYANSARNAGNAWANIGGATMAAQSAQHLGQSIAKPIENAIDVATKFEDKINDIAVAAERLKDQKMIGDRILAIAKASNTAWSKIADGQRAMIGLGGPEMLEKIAPIEGRLARLGFAARAELSDLYKTLYTYMSVAGMSPEQAMKNLEINYKQGKLGSFELKDMARFMPSVSAAAKTYGLSPDQIGQDIPALLQIMRKVVGEPNEAATRVHHALGKLADSRTAERVKDELGVDIFKERREAVARGDNPLFAVMNKISDALEAKGGQGDVSKDGRSIVGGDPEKMGEIAKDYYFRSALNAFNQMRGQLKDFMPTGEEASKTAMEDFTARTKTAASALDRLANAADAAKITAGDTQLENRKGLYDRFTGWIDSMTGWSKSHPKLTNAVTTGGEVLGHGIEGAAKLGGAGLAVWAGWKALGTIGSKMPWLASLGSNMAGVATGVVKAPLDLARGLAQGVNAATVEAVAKAGGAETAKAVAASRGAGLGGAIRAAGTAAGPLPLLGAVDATDDASASYRRMKSDYAARHGHEVESWAGAKEFYGTLFNGIKSMFGERPGSAAGAQAGAAMAAAPAQPTVDAAAAESAKQRILAMGADMKAALDINGAVSMDTAGLDGAIAKALQLVTLLKSAGSLAAQASLGLGRGLKPSSGALHDGPETK